MRFHVEKKQRRKFVVGYKRTTGRDACTVNAFETQERAASSLMDNK